MRKQILRTIVNWKDNKYENGYTILLNLPADLPCMAYLSLEFLKSQNLSNCKEILISLDFAKDYMSPILKNEKFDVPLRIIDNKKIMDFFLKYFLTGSPFKYHWFQIVKGLNNCRTRWIILKGCNYYVNDRNFYENIYERANKSNAILYGTENRIIKGLNFQAIGTWELFVNTKIKKYCKPAELMSQHINGINYDNLIFIQNILKNIVGKQAVQKLKRKPNKIHFFYLIGAYRLLNKTKSKNDAWLRLFLICLMNDLLKNTKWYRQDFISINNYFENYSQILVDDVKEDLSKLYKDILWVVNNRNLNEKRAKKVISILKKRIS